MNNIEAQSVPPEREQLPVLIIEDDSITRRLLERLIRARGHRVTGCESAEKALDVLGCEFFPLIVLDIQLPGMSGLEFCRKLRSSGMSPRHYVLVGTANDRPEDLREILAAGADDYIAKPYHPVLMDVRLSVAEAAVREIAIRTGLERDLVFLARHDPLTKLFNRSQLVPAVERALEAGREGTPSALLYLDLDNFKIVNDTLGHEAGDDLLLRVASILQTTVRQGDALVRFGGDEFVVICMGCPLEEAIAVAKRICGKLEGLPVAGNGRSFRIGVSIGISPIDPLLDASQVIARADAACYAAKAKGRNRVEVHREEQEELARLVSDTNWTSRIREAMRDGGLQLWFQPVVRCADREIAYRELLLRFMDPVSGETVSPAAFLNALQRGGMLGQLDCFVINRAAEILQMDPQGVFSINLSGGTLSDGSLKQMIAPILELSGESQKRVIFEITESELMVSLTQAEATIRELREMGFRFALDDFGVGASSLSYLQALPIDVIKIDGSFIRKLGEGGFNEAVVKAVKVLADALGAETVAEFVQSEEVFRRVRELGIDHAQGHWVGEPSPRV